jgi:DHA2 family multidrug resistance protein-like MFS transporter
VAQDGFGSTAAISIVAGLAFAGVFVRRQQVLADPLIDLQLFRLPAFSAALVTNTFGFFVEFGMAVLIAQYLQLVLGLSPLEAGLWTVPSAAGFIVGSMLTPLLVRWMQPGFAIAGGLTLAAAGFVLLAQVNADSGLGVLVTATVLFSLGLAPVFTLAADLMVGAAPPERAGAAAGISETSSEFGGALGIAVLGSIGTAVYRGEVGDSVPAEAPTEAADAARDTLGGAVAAGEDLAAPVGTDLIEVAREAFTQALQLTSALSAALVLAAAVIAVAVFRRAREAAAPEGLMEPRPDGVIEVPAAPCGPPAAANGAIE